MNTITTPQAAALIGVTATTIKRWAAEGRLHCLRTPGGHRRFDRDEVVRFMAASGGGADDLVSRFADALIGSPEPYAVQSLLMAGRGDLGSWWAVADRLGAALARIGREWSEGRCSIDQEHAATHCLQTALSACLATLPSGDPQRRCLLVAVEDDYHTLGLSLAELVAAEAGWLGAWLGSPTPTSALVNAIERMRPAAVAVSASAWSNDDAIMAARCREISKACRRHRVDLILGGRGAWPTKPAYGVRVTCFEAFSERLRRH